MKAKQFFYACAGVLLLVAADSMGATKAQGQAPDNRVVGVTDFGQAGQGAMFVTENGDVYLGGGRISEGAPVAGTYWYKGNIFTGSVQVEGKSWGNVKDGYRK